MPLALDEAFQVLEAHLPVRFVGMPRPAAQDLQTFASLSIKPSFAVDAALLSDPPAETVATFTMRPRDACVAFALHELFQVREPLLPGVSERIPRPPRQRFQTSAPLRVKLSCAVEGALDTDPLPEPVPVLAVPIRDACVPFALHELFQVHESLLPIVPDGVPGPSGQRFQSSATTLVKSAFSIRLALLVNPLAEPVAVLMVADRNPRVPLLCDEPLQASKAFIPGHHSDGPGPARECLKPSASRRVNRPGPVLAALLLDPLAEWVAVLAMVSWNLRVTLTLNELQEISEAFFPS